MKKTKTLILGSGIGGLGASCWTKKQNLDFIVVDGCKELPMNMHNGVHYLHSIPNLPYNSKLKKVTLTDGILDKGKIHHEPNLEFSLKYSEKVREIQHPSSIMNVGKTKFVFLPENNSMNSFLSDMFDYSGHDNFVFGYWLKEIDTKNKIAKFDNNGKVLEISYDNIISTIPIDTLNKMIKNEIISKIEFKCNPIDVTNFRVEKIVPNWMINLYIPNSNIPIYRASILNGVCSVESIKRLTDMDVFRTIGELKMFHINVTSVERYKWKTGKVLSVNIDDRIHILNELKKLSIYPIGRFGLWNRKLLMDSTIEQAKMVVEHIKINNWSKLKTKLSR